jgi:prepilin-type processing-associated H-X9-DG protein
MQLFVIDRHNGGINALFIDFSVRKVGLKELWKLKWSRGFEVNEDPPVWPHWMLKYRDY